MLEKDYKKRLTVEDISIDPWINKDTDEDLAEEIN